MWIWYGSFRHFCFIQDDKLRLETTLLDVDSFKHKMIQMYQHITTLTSQMKIVCIVMTEGIPGSLEVLLTGKNKSKQSKMCAKIKNCCGRQMELRRFSEHSI